LRFLANENIPLVVVNHLKSDGFDITSATELYQGAGDKKVLKEAVKEGRIILTFDKDYGYLVFRQREFPPLGVILLRISPKSPEFIYTILYKLLKSGLSFEGYFTVVTERKIRSVPLR